MLPLNLRSVSRLVGDIITVHGTMLVLVNFNYTVQWPLLKEGWVGGRGLNMLSCFGLMRLLWFCTWGHTTVGPTAVSLCVCVCVFVFDDGMEGG